MRRCRPFPLPLLLVLSGLVISGLVALAGCGVSTRPAGSHSVDTRPGAIVLQYFEAPGFAMLPFSTSPRWTLYGDGTLIYYDDELAATPDTPPGPPIRGLAQAHLSADAMQAVLHRVIDEGRIFASTKPLYGRVVPDGGNAVLQIAADGKHLVVAVTPVADDDAQSQRLLDVRDYLSGYHADDAQRFALDGIALAAYRFDASAQDQTPAWPFAGISLEAITQRECGDATRADCYPPERLVPIVGDVAGQIARQVPYGQRFGQDGRFYQVYILPLLPDALSPPAGQPPAVLIAQGTEIRSIALSDALP
jgi:hypothetical protein